MTSDGKVPEGMVQLKSKGKSLMAKKSDYLAFKQQMNTKYGAADQSEPKSFYKKTLNSKPMKVFSRISKTFGALSYIYDYSTDIMTMVIYFLSCHENSMMYGMVSLALMIIAFIWPNMTSGKKKLDFSFFKGKPPGVPFHRITSQYS